MGDKILAAHGAGGQLSDELLREVKKISIDVKKIGNYKIFKLPVEFENQEIVVTESLKSALEEKFLSNVHFRLL